MNLKLLNNFAWFIKLSKIESFLKRNGIKQFLIIRNKEYRNLWKKLNKDIDMYNNFYLIFDISSKIQKEEIKDIIKFITFLKKNRKKFIFIVPNKSLINLFEYVLIESEYKKEIPYFSDAIKNFFKKKGIFKNFITGPFYIKELNSEIFFKNSNTKYFELYYIEGLYLYGIKYNNKYVLLNIKNIINLLRLLFKEHAVINKNLFLLYDSKILSKLINNLDKKHIDNIYSYFYEASKIMENLLNVKENKNITPRNICKTPYFYQLITLLLNKFNVDLNEQKLQTIPHLKYIKVKQ